MKVLILCHSNLVPPQSAWRGSKKNTDPKPWRTEASVARALQRLGHDIEFCGLKNEIEPLRLYLHEYRPHIVFNLLEEFSGECLLEPMLVSYLNWLGTPVTGGTPIELLITKNKLATKCLLNSRKIITPSFKRWPKIVKYVNEDSSRGITDNEVVNNRNELNRAKKNLSSKLKAPVFAEEFVAGRELHCGVLYKKGHLLISELLETDFGKKSGPKILTERAKWDFAYRKQMRIKLKPATQISKRLSRNISRVVRGVANALDLKGPARIDLRLNQSEKVFVIEVNANPDLAEGDEFSKCFELSGLNYLSLIETILDSAVSKK